MSKMKAMFNNTYRLEEIIKSDIAELERLRGLAESVSSAFPDGKKVQGGKKGGGLANIIAGIDEHQTILERRIKEYLELLVSVENRIGAIENADEQLVLRLRYVHRKKWEEIAEIMCCTVSNIYKIHRKAYKLLA